MKAQLVHAWPSERRPASTPVPMAQSALTERCSVCGARRFTDQPPGPCPGPGADGVAWRVRAP